MNAAQVVRPVPVNISSGNTGASANRINYVHSLIGSAKAGQTVYVCTTLRYLGTAPTGGLVTDSKGHSWTDMEPGGGGLINARVWIARSVLTADLTGSAQGGSDTITFTFSANNADEILMVVDAVDGSVSNDGSPLTAASIGSSTAHSFSSSAPTATDLTYGCDSYSGGAGPVSSITNGIQVGFTATPANRALVTYFWYPGVTSSVQTTVNWTGTAHAGSMNKISQIVTPQLRVPPNNYRQAVRQAASV